VRSRKDGQFKPRLGRIRSLGNAKPGRTFLSRVSRSISQAGYAGRQSPQSSYVSRPFAGRRRVIVKARIVRHAAASTASLRKHLNYIARDQATRDQDRGKVFGKVSNDMDRGLFAERAEDDRHHFRFIVSPEDGDKMRDLKPFIRDLMKQISSDLGTELDWAAATHANTEHPHAHIVVRGRRDDGRDLVLPRQYIAHGIRERAVDLVTLELGPQTRLEYDQSLAREINAERLTRTDRSLMRAADARGIVDLERTAARYRSHNLARLRTLERMKLARQKSQSQWQLDKNLEPGLKQLGERGDIIKSLNRAAGHRTDRLLDADHAIRHDGPQSREITGAVLQSGVGGEFHDESFVVLDTIDGRILKAPIDQDTDLSELKPGTIVSLETAAGDLKPSDHTINKIAQANSGVYSPTLHEASDPRASPGFITAHVRRLEGLRRADLVERHKDGSWAIPDEYLSKVQQHELALSRKHGVDVTVLCQSSLPEQVLDEGLTWLDASDRQDKLARGFGVEVRQAQLHRRQVLRERGFLIEGETALTDAQKAKLRDIGLEQVVIPIEAETRKRYEPAPKKGSIEGVYSKKVHTSEGPYAVIEKDQQFTLVRWRKVLERGRGLSVAGVAKAGKISWTLARGRSKGLVR